MAENSNDQPREESQEPGLRVSIRGVRGVFLDREVKRTDSGSHMKAEEIYGAQRWAYLLGTKARERERYKGEREK